MAEMFYLKRGDTSPVLRYALARGVDLTGATVRFQMRPRGGGIFIDSSAVIDNESPPVVRYAWAVGDTETAGTFQAEFVVTYGDGSVETFPNVGFIAVIINEDVY
jgi:hypothetical protein